MLPFRLSPTHADEKTTLTSMLDMQRSVLLWKLEGVSEEDAQRAYVTSGTCLLGIIQHMAWVEQWWFVDFIGGGSPDYPWSDEDPDADFRIETGQTIASVSQLYADSVALADAVIAQADTLDITGTLPNDDSDRAERSLRWVLVHMIEETARHAGHLDIIRELIDDATGYYPE
ncbi:MAG: DinB family protein [Acidimicrobiia bacterium]|nr:MAG: DinB family protein [Acidimicrobiia bacterium]